MIQSLATFLGTLMIFGLVSIEQQTNKQRTANDVAAEEAAEAAADAAEAAADAAGRAADAAGDAAAGAEASAEGAIEAGYRRPTRYLRGDIWEQVAASNTGSRYYIRTSDLVSGARTRIIWILGDHSRDATVSYRSTMERTQINCANRSTQTLGGTVRDASDRVIQNIRGQFTAHYPEPGTVWDEMLNNVCGY